MKKAESAGSSFLLRLFFPFFASTAPLFVCVCVRVCLCVCVLSAARLCRGVCLAIPSSLSCTLARPTRLRRNVLLVLFFAQPASASFTSPAPRPRRSQPEGQGGHHHRRLKGHWQDHCRGPSSLASHPVCPSCAAACLWRHWPARPAEAGCCPPAFFRFSPPCTARPLAHVLRSLELPASASSCCCCCCRPVAWRRRRRFCPSPALQPGCFILSLAPACSCPALATQTVLSAPFSSCLGLGVLLPCSPTFLAPALPLSCRIAPPSPCCWSDSFLSPPP